jgi:hypothetical protein
LVLAGDFKVYERFEGVRKRAKRQFRCAMPGGGASVIEQIRCTRLVGRADELDFLRRRANEARLGRVSGAQAGRRREPGARPQDILKSPWVSAVGRRSIRSRRGTGHRARDLPARRAVARSTAPATIDLDEAQLTKREREVRSSFRAGGRTA